MCGHVKQHPPIKKYFRQRAHGIREKHIDKGYRTWQGIGIEQYTIATWIDEFKTSLQHQNSCLAKPFGVGEWDDNGRRNSSVKRKDRTQLIATNDINPNPVRGMQ